MVSGWKRLGCVMKYNTHPLPGLECNLVGLKGAVTKAIWGGGGVGPIITHNRVYSYKSILSSDVYCSYAVKVVSIRLVVGWVEISVWRKWAGWPTRVPQVWFGLVYWGLMPQQQPGSYQGGEMMMMKSVFWWRKPEYLEETTDLRQVTDQDPSFFMQKKCESSPFDHQ